MKLNRKARRANKTRQSTTVDFTPQEQFRAFLDSPGKMYIVNLPGEKSTVIKVRDTDEQFFRHFCGQLTGVLGTEFQVIPATPVDAKFASTQDIAEQTSHDRMRQAEKRSASAEADLEAAIAHHPASKQRPAASTGRHHKADEPESVFDQLVAATTRADDETAKRVAAIEIAAARDQVAAAQDTLETANARLRAAYDAGGELHNRGVIERFTEQAGQAIAGQTESAKLARRFATATPQQSHNCANHWPDAAPGEKWRCHCGRAWEAEAFGELDIRWKPRPDISVDAARQDAIGDALRAADALNRSDRGRTT